MSQYGMPTFITRVALLAILPFRIVAGTATDGVVEQADSSLASLVGVSGQLGAADGARVDIAHDGIVDVQVGGDVAFGDRLTSDDEGRAVKAGPNDVVVGVALENGTEDAIITMVLAQANGEAALTAGAELGAFAAAALAPAALEHDRTYVVPATAANSTITLPAAAANGTRVHFVADGTANGHTVQYVDATGPTNITAALTASKRHLVTAVKVGGKWFATAGVSP